MVLRGMLHSHPYLMFILVAGFSQTRTPVGAKTTTANDEKASRVGNKALQKKDQI